MEDKLVTNLGEDQISNNAKTDIHCPHTNPQEHMGTYGTQPINNDKGDDLGDPWGQGEEWTDILPEESRLRRRAEDNYKPHTPRFPHLVGDVESDQDSETDQKAENVFSRLQNMIFSRLQKNKCFSRLQKNCSLSRLQNTFICSLQKNNIWIAYKKTIFGSLTKKLDLSSLTTASIFVAPISL